MLNPFCCLLPCRSRSRPDEIPEESVSCIARTKSPNPKPSKATVRVGSVRFWGTYSGTVPVQAVRCSLRFGSVRLGSGPPPLPAPPPAPPTSHPPSSPPSLHSPLQPLQDLLPCQPLQPLQPLQPPPVSPAPSSPSSPPAPPAPPAPQPGLEGLEGAVEGAGGAGGLEAGGLGFRFGSMAVRVCRGFGGSRFTRFLRAGSGLRFGSRLSCKP